MLANARGLRSKNPKSSPSGSTSPFCPSAPSPTSRLRTQRPTATAALSAPPHWLTPLISTSISDSAPEIEPQRLDFFILAISPSPTLRLRTQHPPPPPPPHPHHRTTAPPPPTRIHPHFRWRAREIESLWLDFRFLALTPLSDITFANTTPHHHHHHVFHS